MKTGLTILLIGLLTQGCYRENKEAPRIARLEARAAMEQKVSDVIAQLEKDCDSTTLSIAKSRADSIRQARDKKRLRGHRR